MKFTLIHAKWHYHTYVLVLVRINKRLKPIHIQSIINQVCARVAYSRSSTYILLKIINTCDANGGFPRRGHYICAYSKTSINFKERT